MVALNSGLRGSPSPVADEVGIIELGLVPVVGLGAVGLIHWGSEHSSFRVVAAPIARGSGRLASALGGAVREHVAAADPDAGADGGWVGLRTRVGDVESEQLGLEQVGSLEVPSIDLVQVRVEGDVVGRNPALRLNGAEEFLVGRLGNDAVD